MNNETSMSLNDDVRDMADLQGYLKNEILASFKMQLNQNSKLWSTKENVIEVNAMSPKNDESTSKNETDSWDISDENYFKTIDSKELAILEEKCPDISTLENQSINCTACNKKLYVKVGNIVRHPLLGVSFCSNCKHFYGDGMGWDQDEDGSDKYCRWCGRGGEVIVCDNCLKGFCMKCLLRNLGRSKIAKIRQNDEWTCVHCDYQEIQKQKCDYYAVYKYNLKMKELNRINTVAPPRKKQSFVDQVIEDSFQAIQKYQKLLEEQQKSLQQLNEPLNSESAAKFTKSLRKLHKNFRQKTIMIDKSIIKSFSTNFPDDAPKILNPQERHATKSKSKVKSNNTKSKIEIKKELKVKIPKITINHSKKVSPQKLNSVNNEIVSNTTTRSKRKKKVSIVKECCNNQDDMSNPSKKKKVRKSIKNQVPATLPDNEKTESKNNSGSDSEIDIEN